jgi:hypothetical protein
MNSGLISGPVQAAKNGRWRKWELTNSVRSVDLVGAVTSTSESISRIVPIPSYVTAVRVSATGPGAYLNASNSSSGAACKNVIFSILGGRRFLVAMDEFGIWFGVLLHAQETSVSAAASQFDVGVRLSSTTGTSVVNIYKRGAAISGVTGTADPLVRSMFGGTFVTGFTHGATTGAANPLNPQVRALNSSGQQPSMLFGGPLADISGNVSTALPGAAYAGFDPNTYQCSPAYICVEWME